MTSQPILAAIPTHCLRCGAPVVQPKQPWVIKYYCGPVCRAQQIYKRKKAKKNKPPVVLGPCLYCGTQVEPPRIKYCSDLCMRRTGYENYQKRWPRGGARGEKWREKKELLVAAAATAGGVEGRASL